jgi:hypothetical protein
LDQCSAQPLLGMVGARSSAGHGNCSDRKPHTSPRSVGLDGRAEFTDDCSGDKVECKCAELDGSGDEAREDLVMSDAVRLRRRIRRRTM